MPLILSKLLSILKKHWQPILVGIAAVIVVWQIRSFFVKRENDLLRRESALLTKLDDIDKEHKIQIEKIKKAYEEEQKRREENIRRLEEDLKVSKEKYCILVKELEDKKRKNITKLVDDYKEDPKGLAEKVKKITGFELVLPEEFGK